MSKQLKEFQELMHWTNEEMIAQFCWALCVESKLVAECCEAEEELARLASEYNDADWMDFYPLRLIGLV